jgi:uncharacterized protein YcsI (UPF0317 family)
MSKSIKLGIVEAVTKAVRADRDDYAVFVGGCEFKMFNAVVSNDGYDFLDRDSQADSMINRVRTMYSAGVLSHMKSISVLVRVK